MIIAGHTTVAEERAHFVLAVDPRLLAYRRDFIGARITRRVVRLFLRALYAYPARAWSAVKTGGSGQLGSSFPLEPIASMAA
jgi:hypothetical protein